MKTGKSLPVVGWTFVGIGIMCTVIVIVVCDIANGWLFIPVGLVLGQFFLMVPFFVDSIFIFQIS